MHTCFHKNCGNPAPYGYGWPGHRSDKPAGKHGYLWACSEHREAAKARQQAAVRGRAA